jgi:hypothetical protein
MQQGDRLLAQWSREFRAVDYDLSQAVGKELSREGLNFR